VEMMRTTGVAARMGGGDVRYVIGAGPRSAQRCALAFLKGPGVIL